VRGPAPGRDDLAVVEHNDRHGVAAVDEIVMAQLPVRVHPACVQIWRGDLQDERRVVSPKRDIDHVSVNVHLGRRLLGHRDRPDPQLPVGILTPCIEVARGRDRR